jgi:hypothetical protein
VKKNLEKENRLYTLGIGLGNNVDIYAIMILGSYIEMLPPIEKIIFKKIWKKIWK